ncbi:sensor histidine kinase [Fusibacter bizertensis]
MKRNPTQSVRKNKTLKQQILMPYIILIIVMSLVVILGLNIAIRTYVRKVSNQQIQESRDTVIALLRKDLNEVITSDDAISDTLAARTKAVVASLSSSVKLTKNTSETEIAILGASGNTLIPREPEISAELYKAIENAKERIVSGVSTDTFTTRVKGINYLVSYEKLNEVKTVNRKQYLLIMTSQEGTTLLIRRINFLLIGIMTLVTIVGAILASRVAKGVTKPIQEISRYSRRIIEGDYSPIETETTALELEALCMDLNQMSRSLQDREQSKVDFLQNFSHDLRTPLMSIQGYAEGIVTGVFDEATKPASIIANESIRLKHLVDQLITLSRLESTQVNLLKDELNLYDFLNLLIERYEGLATKEHKHIALNCSRSLSIKTNEDHLDKIISNLLSNAIRYAKTHVIVDVTSDDEKVFIRIQDDGPGVPKALLPHIFDRFYKGEDGNFGLGTAIAYTAAGKIGGTIEAENHPNGALFKVTLHKIH